MIKITKFAIIFFIIWLGNSSYIYASTQDYRQKIVDETIDNINFCIANMYIRSRETKKLPQSINNFQQLIDFLNRTYPDSIGKELIATINKINNAKGTYAKEENKYPSTKEFLEKVVRDSAYKLLFYNPYHVEMLESSIYEILNQASQKLSKIPSKDKTKAQVEKHTSVDNESSKRKITIKEQFSNYYGQIVLLLENQKYELFALVFLLLLFFFVRRNSKHSQFKQEKPSKMIKNDNTPVKDAPSKQVKDEDEQTDNCNKEPKTVPSFNKWLVTGESVIGSSHIESKLPCQDSHFYEEIDNGWGIAIVADGAGSAKNSQIGSAFVAQESAPKWFKKLLSEKAWPRQNKLPSKEEWHNLAKNTLIEVRRELEDYAKGKKLESKSLACTLIVVIYSPIGILVTHIGDGRAAYCNQHNEWKPLIIPWKGEEANATIFMTSNIWNKHIDNFIGSQVIEDKIIAFTLMSDGCEKASFECSQINPVTKQWSDPNKPYPKFFQPLVAKLQNLGKQGLPAKEIQEKWQTFLESGNQTLIDEYDDKTLILGVLR